jgi:hypothetical protein
MFRDFNKYEVFEDGRIWSYKTKRFLKPGINQDGYQQVALSDNEGKIKMYLVHRVVYESVTGNPIPDGMQVNHINECKTDNRFENLNLMTCKENINWGSGIERRAKAHSKAMTNNPKISKQVGAFKNNELVMTFPSTNEAQRQGFDQSSVAACCRNCFNRVGNNVYKGYTWKYI